MKKRYFIALIFTGLLLVQTHHIWLGMKYAKHFDLLILLIIIICGYLLCLKLTSYMADFKDLKNKSRIEIIFLAIFGIICILPLLSISKEEKSNIENRTLAVYKPLINEDFSINKNFGKDFNDWFSDRFYLRENLINLDGQIKYYLSYDLYDTIKCVYSKKTNWTINKGALTPTGYNKQQLYLIADNFNQLKRYCDNKNIKLYILIVPTKSVIYPQETGFRIYDNQLAQRIEEEKTVINYLHKNTDCKIIYPYNELLEGKKQDYVFFKTEHHWTDWGAYIGYRELGKEIKKDFPNYHILTLNEYNKSTNKLVRGDFNREFCIGLSINQLALPKYIKKNVHKVLYTYYNNKNEYSLSCVSDSDKKVRVMHYPNNNHLKIFSTGTSMNENLNQFLPYSVEDTLLMRFNNVKGLNDPEGYKLYKRFNNKITEYKPNIMVVCLTFGNLKHIPHLFDKE